MSFGLYELAVLFAVVFLLAIVPILVIATLVYLVSKKAQRSSSSKSKS